MSMLEAIAIAADAIGADGKGRDGLVGYMKTLAREQPKLFASLLAYAVSQEQIDTVERRRAEADQFGNVTPSQVEWLMSELYTAKAQLKAKEEEKDD